MANQTITQLPDAGAITGTELVPIVQNGGTVKTTASALAGSPVQTQTFLTLNQEPTLNNSRYLSSGTGVGLTDGGAQSFYRITLNGVSGTLETMGNGLAVNVGGIMTARSIATSGAGVAVTNGNGQSGNPTIALDGTVGSLANNAGTGFLALPGNGTVAGRTLTGAASQIDISNPNGIAGNPTFSIADNPVLPGLESVTVPIGDTADRPASPVNGMIRYNSESGLFEGYLSNAWSPFTSGVGTGVTSVATGTGLTGGPITSTGTISIDNTVVTLTDTQTLTNKTLTSPEITDTIKFTGTGASSYTPFVQTFASYVTNLNGYQLNYIQNTNNGTDASVDYVAYNDASDVDSYFIDMGITSTNYTNPTFTVFPANGGYVYTGGGTSGQASALLLGTSNVASDVIFFTGGTLLANIRATIKGTGNFLIGTSTDTGYKLNVNGTTYFGGASTFGSTVLLNANPTQPLEAATKQYVDAAASGGFVVHDPVVYATIAALPANTYNNGASGVGATLTATANGALSVDSTAVATSQRILVRNEVAQANNGVYTVTQTGSAGTPYILTRATDFDTATAGNIANNAYFFVTSGPTQVGDSYILSQTAAITVGTTALPFTLFANQTAYTGGTNITVTGQVIDVSGTIAATLGGTGTSTVTTGDLLYGSAANTWSKLPLGVAYKSLIVNASGAQVEWNAIPLNQAAAVSGQLGVASGGTGVATLTGYVVGNGTSAFTASATIPNTDISGLGTMSTQAASAVVITGGTINGTTIGATTATTGIFTTVTATTGVFGGTF